MSAVQSGLYTSPVKCSVESEHFNVFSKAGDKIIKMLKVVRKGF